MERKLSAVAPVQVPLITGVPAPVTRQAAHVVEYTIPCVCTLPVEVQVAVAPVTETAKLKVSFVVLECLAAITSRVPTDWLLE
jgi:hypothetical protein